MKQPRWLFFALFGSWYFSILLGTLLSVPAVSGAQQPWSGIISPARAADWTQAGLPGDAPPDGAWTQCGSTIAAYGSASSYASPATIQNAINACGNNQYVLLGPGSFYISPNVYLKSNMVLRGSGPNQTFIYFNSSNGGPGCNGPWGGICINGSNTYVGGCSSGSLNLWTCFPGASTGWGILSSNSANWTAGYSQGASTITLDNVSGITVNVTPIVLDQCDTGMSGAPNVEGCYNGTAGGITAASVLSGGSGYSVGDTGKILCTVYYTPCWGAGNATYQVTSVSGGAVTGFNVTAPGNGYTYSSVSTGGPGATTAATSGSGSGFMVNITAINNNYDNGGFFICAMSMICESEGPSNTSRPARSQEEVVIATAISGSGPYTVTLNHPLMHPNWNSGQTPQAWWPNSTITNVGVENLWMMPTAGINSSCIVLGSASKVWVKGFACSTANAFHVYAAVTSNLLVRDSYFYLTATLGTTSYGIGATAQVGNSLFENNIIQGVVDPENPDGSCTGCVFAYNFAVNDYDADTDYMYASNPMHAAATDYILEEGNIGAAAALDSVHGPHLANTFFRNYFTGYEASNGVMPTRNTIPVYVGAYSRYNNFLANVLGTTGFHDGYQCAPTSSSTAKCPLSSWNYIWDSGWSHSPSMLDYGNNPPAPNDLLTVSSLYRYGNYDTVNNSVQWNNSEVPTSDPNFPNPVPGSNTFPASFYNGVKGAYPNCGTSLQFWENPTTGSCPPYPNIGPDVTSGDIGMCTSGTYKWSRALTSSQCAGGTFSASVNGGFGNSNPAMRCYLNQMGGPPDGTGSMLTFNPAACYALDNGTKGAPPKQPQPANGLTASPVVTP